MSEKANKLAVDELNKRMDREKHLKQKLTQHFSVQDYHSAKDIHEILKKVHPGVKLQDVGYNGNYHYISHFGMHTPEYHAKFKEVHKSLGGFSYENDGHGVFKNAMPKDAKGK